MKRSAIAMIFAVALTAGPHLARSATTEAPKPAAATYAGTEVCRACHASQFEKFSQTQMGKIFSSTRATKLKKQATWHELLARFEYQWHKNVALRFGYYLNKAREKDYGVDIMKPWMGDVIDPQASATALTQLQRSVFLGDQIKGPFTAYVGFVTLRFKF